MQCNPVAIYFTNVILVVYRTFKSTYHPHIIQLSTSNPGAFNTWSSKRTHILEEKNIKLKTNRSLYLFNYYIYVFNFTASKRICQWTEYLTTVYDLWLIMVCYDTCDTLFFMCVCVLSFYDVITIKMIRKNERNIAYGYMFFILF